MLASAAHVLKMVMIHFKLILRAHTKYGAEFLFLHLETQLFWHHLLKRLSFCY